MENLIYLIILIAWAAYSIYRQSQKKKEAGASKPARPSRPQGEWKGGTLEEILFGKKDPSEEPEQDMADPLKNIWQPSGSQEGVSLEEFYENPEAESPVKKERPLRFEAEKPAPDKEVAEAEKDARERENWLRDFDLRKAVIYAEILNRPYD